MLKALLDAFRDESWPARGLGFFLLEINTGNGYGSKLLILQIDGVQLNMTIIGGSFGTLILSHCQISTLGMTVTLSEP